MCAEYVSAKREVFKALAGALAKQVGRSIQAVREDNAIALDQNRRQQEALVQERGAIDAALGVNKRQVEALQQQDCRLQEPPSQVGNIAVALRHLGAANLEDAVPAPLEDDGVTEPPSPDEAQLQQHELPAPVAPWRRSAPASSSASGGPSFERICDEREATTTTGAAPAQQLADRNHGKQELEGRKRKREEKAEAQQPQQPEAQPEAQLPRPHLRPHLRPRLRRRSARLLLVLPRLQRRRSSEQCRRPSWCGYLRPTSVTT